MVAAPRLGLVLVAFGILCSAACSDDDAGGTTRDCREADGCSRCTCQFCPCDGACEQGRLVYQACVDGCFSEVGGEAVLTCMEGCETRTTGSTRAYMTCEKSVVSNQCASACPQ